MNLIPLSEHIAMETEGELSPAQANSLAAAEQQLDEARWMKVMRMTARRFGELDAVERRNYTRWAKHLARVLNEKAAMFERNTPAELDIPPYLQARG